MKKNKSLVMIGTGFDTMGGISSVVNVYRAGGLFEAFDITYLATHRDGGAIAKLTAMISALLRMLGLLLRGRVGLLHIHVSSRFSFWRKSLFFIPAFLCRVPIVLHLHGSEFAIFYERECGAFRRLIVRFIFNRAARVVVLSATWRDWVRKISSNPHIQAIYNPVMLPPTPPVWEARHAGEVLFLGRLGRRKGTYDLVAAAAMISSKYPQLRLLLGGDGELEQVRDWAFEKNVGDKTKLLGWVSGKNRSDYLSAAQVYCLPSYNEGLPMSVLEAMAAGLPILSTPIGGIPEAVTDGLEGFLVEAGDVENLAKRLGELLEHPDLACSMGAAARLKVMTTFSSEAILPLVAQVYKELGMLPVRADALNLK